MISYRHQFRGTRMAPVPTQPTVPETRSLRSALIVDDHPLFCDALAMTLTGPVGIAEVKSVGSLKAALERLAQPGKPDVIVLDLNLPDVNGLDGVVRIRQAAPDIPIVIVSSLDEMRVVRAAVQAGVNAFVPKHAEREEFARAFTAIAAGELHISGDALDPAAQAASDEAVRRLALLTRQQAKILELIGTGLMNKQIAYELSIAETTVKAHVTAIMRKLGVQTRMQAVLFAQEASFAHLVSDT